MFRLFALGAKSAFENPRLAWSSLHPRPVDRVFGRARLPRNLRFIGRSLAQCATLGGWVSRRAIPLVEKYIELPRINVSLTSMQRSCAHRWSPRRRPWTGPSPALTSARSPLCPGAAASPHRIAFHEIAAKRRKRPSAAAATKAGLDRGQARRRVKNRQGNFRQRNNSRPGLFPIPLPNIPLPILALCVHRGKAIVSGIEARDGLFHIPLTIVPLTNHL
jgi:hypothetical protein